MSTKCSSGAGPYPLCPFGTSPLDKGSRPRCVLPNPSLLPAKPSEAGSPGRGGARERTQFSPPGGNGVEWTLRRRAAVGKVTRRPQAAKSHCEERNRSIIVPSSAPVCALGHLPPRGKAIVVGRRNEVSHKVLCQAFFQESGKTLSSRDWDESVWFASWCHPISERPGRSLWTPCCGGGAAPVSRPAGGAVFGRVRLRGVLSTWGRSPWDLSLSGGIPVTHAPSWR